MLNQEKRLIMRVIIFTICLFLIGTLVQAQGKQLPKINNNFAEGKESFELVMDMQGQSFPMEMTRTTTKKGDNWVVKDEINTPQGAMGDEVEFNAGFEPVARNLAQGPMSVKMSFANGKASIDAAGNASEVSFSEVLIVDGPGSDLVFAGLPLAQGYQLVFETIDQLTMQAKKVTLTYIGEEVLNDTKYIKVETVANADANEKTTYWINPATKKADKMVSVIPAFGNAVLTITRN